MAKKGHNLNGTELQVNYFDTCKEENPLSLMNATLEISNLPQNVAEGMLELYLESPKAGGYSGAVKNITFIGPGVARVQFDDAKSNVCIFL